MGVDVFNNFVMIVASVCGTSKFSGSASLLAFQPGAQSESGLGWGPNTGKGSTTGLGMSFPNPNLSKLDTFLSCFMVGRSELNSNVATCCYEINHSIRGRLC